MLYFPTIAVTVHADTLLLCFTSNYFRRLGYGDDLEQKPSHVELVTVQATAGMVAGACSSIITTPHRYCKDKASGIKI